MGITLWVYKKPLTPIETEVATVESESSTLKELLPDGRRTKCTGEYRETSHANCGEFDEKIHCIIRGEDGRISSTKSRIGKCKLTNVPCLRVAEYLERAITSEREEIG